jgi:hypothetical protein
MQPTMTMTCSGIISRGHDVWQELQRAATLQLPVVCKAGVQCVCSSVQFKFQSHTLLQGM